MALLAGPWDAPGMRRRVTAALGRDRQPRWVFRLVTQVLDVYPSAPRDGPPHVGSLCRLLDVDAGELEWFADTRGLERHVGMPLRHYRWAVLPKRNGARLLAAPKPRLKEIQRRLLRHVLAPMPLHTLAHGGVRGRSVRTALAPHAGAAVVIRADLEAFFSSIAAPRIFGVVRAAGYPEAVAHMITGLCTTVVPHSVW
jgi:hypothetical protein